MKSILLSASLPLLALGFAGALNAAVYTGDYDYKEGNTEMRGYAAYEKTGGKLPGILVVHEWMGLDDYAKSRAKQLAGMGYVVLAADIYGKGVRPSTMEEAAAQAGVYRADRKLMRARAAAALAALKKLPGVDPVRPPVMGYCFGGGVALELARSGADIRGAASFHGSLDTPDPLDARNIKGKVIVFHGADDPHVTAAAVAAFEAEMRGAGADWQLNSYGGAVHRFSNPAAGGDVKSGAAYNEKADRRSWKALQAFFAEIFGK